MTRIILLFGMMLILSTVGVFPAFAEENPQSFDEAVRWLEQKSTEMIHACGRPTTSGITAFPPQVGGGYEAFWLRDYAYMLEGNVAAFTDKELREAYLFLLEGQRADGAMVDCVKFDGTPIYMPGFGTLGKEAVADGSPFMVDVAWHTYRKTRDKKLLGDTIDRLERGMKVIPRNPDTGLVYITPGAEQERCPYGFTDTVRKQGDELFCSLLLVQASRQLSDLYRDLDRKESADGWSAESEKVAEAIRKVFWNEEWGLFRAATALCNQPDIWGSAFAVFLDIATPEQAKRIARYFDEHHGELVKRGQLRHLPGGVYWESICCDVKKDTYQNGAYWATPIGWYVYTLDRVNPERARRTVVDLVADFKVTGDENECVNDHYANVSHYIASTTLPLDGIRKLRARTPKQ